MCKFLRYKNKNELDSNEKLELSKILYFVRNIVENMYMDNAKRYCMMISNINDILKYVGFNIYIKRIDLGLKEDEYLYKDLINSEVIDTDNTKLGKVIEILNGNNVLIKVKGTKEFFIPLIANYVSKFDLNKKILYTKNAKELIF